MSPFAHRLARWSGLLWLLLASTTSAQSGLGSWFGASESDILPVEQAFAISTSQPDDDTLAVHIDIQKGYYVYQASLDFALGPQAPAIEQVDYPAAKRKADEFFGEQPVYTQPATFTLNLAAALNRPTPISVNLQGCADAGVCYPPYQVQLSPSGDAPTWTINPSASRLNDNAATSQAADSRAEQASANAAPATDTSRLGALLTGASVPAMLGGFFAAGLLLAFTACLYPMIPILSGLIAGDPQRSGSARAFVLSLIYIESTALTYALAGVAAGITGAAVQADLQSPWVLGSFAAVFAVLALAMFGVFELRLPSALQTRLTALANRQKGGTLIGVALMGVLSTLIVGACSGPALIAALVFIGSTGDAWLGGLALFTLANGMGLPLLLIGTAAGRWLPRSGPWMNAVRAVFGVGFLAVALWLLERFLLGPITLGLWGLLFIGMGVGLGVFERSTTALTPARRATRALGVAFMLWGAASLLGAASGASNVLQPLANLSAERSPSATQSLSFRAIDSTAELNRALAEARNAGRPVMLDIYAGWCIYCIQIEQRTLTEPGVQQALASALLLRADVTDMTDAHRELMRELNVYLPPAILFYGADGQEARSQRVVSFIKAPEFITRAKAGFGAEQP